MNERIKELAEQSGFYVDLEPILNDSNNIIRLQKFAELIVKECAGIYEAINNGNQIEGTDNYIKALRIRFEV